MRSRPCTYCRSDFRAARSGLPSLFCSRCTERCEHAFHALEHYLSEHPDRSIDEAVKELLILPLFTHYLERFGYMVRLRHRFCPDQPNIQCALCHHRLSPHLDVYCADCQLVIEKRLHVRYGMGNPITGSNNPISPPSTRVFNPRR
jgi:hypothetical protein